MNRYHAPGAGCQAGPLAAPSQRERTMPMTDYITWVRDLTDALTDLEIATGQPMRPPLHVACVDLVEKASGLLPALRRQPELLADAIGQTLAALGATAGQLKATPEAGGFPVDPWRTQNGGLGLALEIVNLCGGVAEIALGGPLDWIELEVYLDQIFSRILLLASLHDVDAYAAMTGWVDSQFSRNGNGVHA